MNTGGHMLLLDNLQNLLEKQIEMARKSNFRCLEELAMQSESIVEEIIGTKTFEGSEFDVARNNISELYKKLELILVAAQDSVKKQQRQVSEGRKTLQAYSDST